MVEDPGGRPPHPAESLHRARSRIRTLEEELDMTIRGITALTLELEGSQDRFRRVVENIAHELRSPLHAALQSAHLLREPHASEEDERLHDALLRNLHRITDLIDHMWLLTGIEQERDRPVSLRALVERVLGQVEEEAHVRGVEIRVVGSLPEHGVEAAPVELALRNLVTNSLKYSDPRKEERWVTISVEFVEDERERGWRIIVADNGVGIPPELQGRIFERYFRATPRIAEGAGIGLSIARQLITERGGSLSFESTWGEGSRFHLVLPLEAPQDRPAAAREKEGRQEDQTRERSENEEGGSGDPGEANGGPGPRR